MNYKRNVIRRKVYKKKPTVKKAIRRVKRAVLTRAIKRTVKTMSEIKRANYNVNNFALTSVLSNDYDQIIKFINPTSATGALYNIQQGTGQGARVGNKISTKKCMLSGVVHINTEWSAQNYNMCPLYVALYVFKIKQGLVSIADCETIVKNRFFSAGNSSTGFSGALRDLLMEVNTDVVTLLKKRVFKVGTGVVQSATANNVANTLNQSFNDGTATIAKMFKIDITKCMAKTYIFNDTDNSPQNSGTYFMWVPLRVDGGLIVTSGGLATGTLPCWVDYSIDYHYMDI